MRTLVLAVAILATSTAASGIARADVPPDCSAFDGHPACDPAKDGADCPTGSMCGQTPCATDRYRCYDPCPIPIEGPCEYFGGGGGGGGGGDAGVEGGPTVGLGDPCGAGGTCALLPNHCRQLTMTWATCSKPAPSVDWSKYQTSTSGGEGEGEGQGGGCAMSPGVRARFGALAFASGASLTIAALLRRARRRGAGAAAGR